MTMTNLARSVLSTKATSVSSEGMNSKAKSLVNSYRTNLDEVDVEATLRAQSRGHLLAAMKERTKN